VPVYLEIYQPAASEVKVTVVTVYYRKVKEIHGSYPAGFSRIPVDLIDNWQRPLANGLYYLMVESSAGRQVAKLLILK
jgi:hypothetical protein